MKKIFLIALFIAYGVGARAQFIEKGALIANGSLSFFATKYKTSDDKYSGFNLTPTVAYFVMDNLAVGAMINYDHSKYESKVSPTVTSKYTNNALLVGPVVRYYLNQGIFFHGDLGFGSNKSTNETGTTKTESKYDIMQYRVGVGYAIRIGENAFIDPVIGYKSNKEKYTGGNDTESGLFWNDRLYCEA